MAYCEDCGLPESECICWEEQSELHDQICPNCGCVWGWEETEWERCFSCGWPLEDYYNYDMQDYDFLTEIDDEEEGGS